MLEVLIVAMALTVPCDIVRRRSLRQQERLDVAFRRAQHAESPYGRFYLFCCN